MTYMLNSTCSLQEYFKNALVPQIMRKQSQIILDTLFPRGESSLLIPMSRMKDRTNDDEQIFHHGKVLPGNDQIYRNQNSVSKI